MGIEGNRPGQIIERVAEFARLSIKGGVSNWIIEGPVADVPTVLKAFVALFPSAPPTEDRTFLIVTTDGQYGSYQASWYYSRILNLSLSQRITKLGIKEDESVRRSMERRCVINGMPSIMLAFGRVAATNKNVVILFSVMGTSPESALRELQEVTRQRLARLS